MINNKIKTALASLAIFSLFLFSNIDTQACPFGWQTGIVDIQIQLGPDCYMEFDYCRDYYASGLPGSVHEEWGVFIEAVRFVGDCDTYRYDFEMDPGKYFEMAAKAVILQDNFFPNTLIPPCPAQSPSIIRLGHASCYSHDWVFSWVSVPNHPDGGYWSAEKAPCDQEEESYCWDRFSTCLEYDATTETWNVIFTYESGIIGGDCGDGCDSYCR